MHLLFHVSGGEVSKWGGEIFWGTYAMGQLRVSKEQ